MDKNLREVTEADIVKIDEQSKKANYLATDFETPELQRIMQLLKSEENRHSLKEGERKVLSMDYDELIKEYNLIVDKKSNESAANRNRVVQVILRLIKDNRLFINKEGYVQPY